MSNLFHLLGTGDLREQRLTCLRAEVEAENQHDLAAAIAQFSRPRYEIVPFDSIALGAQAVFELLQRWSAGFPNLHAELFTTYCAETAVIGEGRLVGAQFGPWSGLPASGRVINLPFVVIFDFEDAHLLGKKVYFDSGLMMRQLTGSG
jgi:predicted ester cyclase